MYRAKIHSRLRRSFIISEKFKEESNQKLCTMDHQVDPVKFSSISNVLAQRNVTTCSHKAKNSEIENLSQHAPENSIRIPRSIYCEWVYSNDSIDCLVMDAVNNVDRRLRV